MCQVRWGRLPLTQRLTLLFTAVAASVVLGLGALFLVESERHFVELDRMALQNKQRLIEDLLRNANSADDARGRLGEALSYHHGLYALVQDGQGFVVFRSQGLSPPMRGEEALHKLHGRQVGGAAAAQPAALCRKTKLCPEGQLPRIGRQRSREHRGALFVIAAQAAQYLF